MTPANDTFAHGLTRRFEQAFLQRRVTTVANDDRPLAYAGPYPIRSHRTLAELWGCNNNLEPNGAA